MLWGGQGEGQRERDRGRERRIGWVSIVRGRRNHRSSSPCIFTFRKKKTEKCGKRTGEKRIWKEHERKKSSLNALRISLFPSLPPSRASLNLILNPLQFPPRDSILSFPVSILFHSLAFILRLLCVFWVPSCTSLSYCKIIPVPDIKSQSIFVVSQSMFFIWLHYWVSGLLLLEHSSYCK